MTAASAALQHSTERSGRRGGRGRHPPAHHTLPSSGMAISTSGHHQHQKKFIAALASRVWGPSRSSSTTRAKAGGVMLLLMARGQMSVRSRARSHGSSLSRSTLWVGGWVGEVVVGCKGKVGGCCWHDGLRSVCVQQARHVLASGAAAGMPGD